MCNAGSQQEKEESTGQVLQDLAKQPESVLDPNRWYKILEVCTATPNVLQDPGPCANPLPRLAASQAFIGNFDILAVLALKDWDML